MEAALALCRFAHFAAAMTLFGATAFVVALAPPVSRARFAPATRAIAAAAIPIAALSALVWLALEAASMAGDWSALVDPETFGAVVTDTAFGAVWLGRLVLSAALVVALALGRARPDARARRRRGTAAREPRPRRPRRDADGRGRRAPSRQRRVASAGDGGVVRRPADVRALPQGFSRPEPERSRA